MSLPNTVFRCLRSGSPLPSRWNLVEQVADLAADAVASPTEMRLKDLTDVHAARHAERVQHDVDRRAVFQMRHVFDRNDLGDDALVAVTAGHLVARLKLALHGDEDLDHLHHARRQFVAAAQLVDLVGEARFEAVLGFVVLLAQRFDLALRLVVAQRESATIEPWAAIPASTA